MALDINRLGQAVRARRDELDMTQLDVASAGGPSNSTLTKLESGEADAVSPATLRKLDAGLDWQAGTARALLRGEAPVSAQMSSLEDFTDVELVDELARRLRQREDVGIDDSSTATRQAPGSGADIHQLHEPGMPSPGAETTKAARAGTVTPNPLEGVGEEHQGEAPDGGA